ncbi:MAG: NADH-quinone oxidoreductase subunit NuoE [Chloroflexota bacterium]
MQESALKEVLSSHSAGDRGSLVPVLQEIQTRLGYLPEAAMLEVARQLRVDEATVYSVATFYAQFKLVPTGKHMVKVCLGTACHVQGGQRILEAAERGLGIHPGATTEDLEFSLEQVACFGSCALAPVVVVDRDVYGRMTNARVKQILEKHTRQGHKGQ